jgi:hypothetical protein
VSLLYQACSRTAPQCEHTDNLLACRSWTGEHVRTHEWHQFLGYNEASVRACNPAMDKQHEYCPNQYDTMGTYTAAYEHYTYE